MADTKIEHPKKPEQATADPTATAIQQLADAIIARGPKTPLEALGLTPEQQRTIQAAPASRRYRIIPGSSPDTGATFGMLVVEEPDTKKYPQGKVVNFRGYSNPPDTWVYEDQGGRLPTGFRVFQDGRVAADVDPNCPPMGLTIQAKEWRRKTFYTRDHQSIIGRALRVAYCDDSGLGIKTPWETAVATDAAAE